MSRSALWGEPLANELARDLAGTRVVPLAAIEPCLDPAVHHTNLPYAIISDRHTIAIVEGEKIAIDGPQRTNNNHRYAKTPQDVAANRAEIARVAEVWGVTAPAEDAGLVDTALSIMRFLKQRGTWSVYVSGDGTGLEGYIAARGGAIRWPAGLHLSMVEGGIRLTCGDSKRDIRSLAELTDFATREAPILDAQVLWCTQFTLALTRIKPVVQALLEVVRGGFPDRIWSLGIPDEYFLLDTRQAGYLCLHDASENAGVVEIVADGFQLTIGDSKRTVSNAAELTGLSKKILKAIKVWLASPGAEPPVRDMDYYR